MIRWPVSCIVQVWTYSAANDADEDAEVEQRQPVEPVEIAGGDVADRSRP